MSELSSQPRALFRSPTYFETILKSSLANILGRKIVNVQYRWCSSLVRLRSSLILKTNWSYFKSKLGVNAALWCPVHYRQVILLSGRDFNLQVFISINRRLKKRNKKLIIRKICHFNCAAKSNFRHSTTFLTNGTHCL